MIEILLIRHGVPACDHRTPIRGRHFARWVEAYDDAPLDLTLPPPPALQALAATIPLLVTSTMRRAVESGALIAPNRPAISDPLYDEAGIPTAFGLGLALRPTYWDALARVAWMLGWSPDVESVHEAKVRAERAADQLASLALTHGSIMLVGHGMLNTLIAGALRRDGWIGSGSPRVHWGRVILRNAVKEPIRERLALTLAPTAID